MNVNRSDIESLFSSYESLRDASPSFSLDACQAFFSLFSRSQLFGLAIKTALVLYLIRFAVIPRKNRTFAHYFPRMEEYYYSAIFILICALIVFFVIFMFPREFLIDIVEFLISNSFLLFSVFMCSIHVNMIMIYKIIESDNEIYKIVGRPTMTSLGSSYNGDDEDETSDI